MSSETRSWRVLFWLVLAGLTSLQALLIIFSPLDLSGDEAHYWEWSKRIDLAYYSKGPIVAIIIGALTSVFGDNHFGVRAVALVSELLLAIMFFNYIARNVDERAAFWSSCLLLSMPMFFSMGVITTTDPLTALFTMLCLDSVNRLSSNRNWWFGSFIFVGLAILTKYTAVLLLPVLLATAIKRGEFWTREFLVGCLAVAVIVSPILIWNVQHDWVNFAHNAGHVASKSFKPQFLLELIGAQLGLAGPVVFVFLGLSFLVAIRRWRDEQIFPVLMFSLLLCGVCLAVSMTKRVYANWPMPVLLMGAILFGLFFNELRERSMKWILRGIALNGLIVTASAMLFMGVTFGISPQFLPTKKLVGFRELSNVVGLSLKGSDFVLSESYDLTSAIAFYLGIPRRSFCAYVDDRRMNQYDIWGGFEREKGRDAVIVLKHPENLAKLSGSFLTLSLIRELPINFGGVELRRYYLYKGEKFSGKAPSIPEKR